MGHSRFHGDEIARQGQEIYDRDVRARVETEENIGKILALDIETGEYEIDDDPIAAADRIFARHPGAAIFGAKIGYNAVNALGGALTRTSS